MLPIEDKIKKVLKQILRYIIKYKYIRSMPCYFVSNGVEMSMTNQTFDVIWNGFGNKELTDSETSSSSEEGDKTGSFVEKAINAEWRKQDDGYYNRKPNDKQYFQKYYQEKTKQPCAMRYMRLCHELQVKLGKAQENQKVPKVLSVSSL